MFPELRLIIYNTLVNFVVVLIEMGWKADNKFIQKCSNTVDISPPIMTLPH